jgi:FKBP-type peptidyl-prolyl cis-trans isomerase (trigger factor)
VERFEQAVPRSIGAQNLKAFVTSSVTVSDEEVEDKYRRDTMTLNLTYLVVSPEKLAEKISVSDDELRASYEQHKTDYRINEPQKKIRYVYINQEKAGSKLQISDKELRERYDQLSPEMKQAGVKVQQILLKVASPALDAQVEQKAKDLIAKLRVMAQPQPKSPCEVAKGNSETRRQPKRRLPYRLVKKNPTRLMLFTNACRYAAWGGLRYSDQ